jgi:hypothetical protein
MLCPPDLSPPPSRQSVLTGCRHSMQMGIVVAFSFVATAGEQSQIGRYSRWSRCLVLGGNGIFAGLKRGEEVCRGVAMADAGLRPLRCGDKGPYHLGHLCLDPVPESEHHRPSHHHNPDACDCQWFIGCLTFAFAYH